MRLIERNYIIGILFLVIQLCVVIYSQFIPERFFCWAPYDQHTHYEIIVEINDELLTNKQIKERYKYKPKGWEPRSIHNIFNMITQYENTYETEGNINIKVMINYSINGLNSKTWYLEK